jgi:predicted amidohydrolase
MRLALIQLRSSASEPGENVAAALRRIDSAAELGQHDLFVLPEFFNTPYFAQSPEIGRHVGYAEPEDGPSLTAVREKARSLGTSVVASIYEDAGPGLLFDTAFLIGPDGELAGRYRKTHAPAIEGGYEKLYYRPGSEFPVFAVGPWRVGILICYDWRFPEAARSLAVQGAELIVLPFATPPMRMWNEGLRTRAWENQVYVAACNRVGLDGDWDFSGTSLVADPYGELVAQASDSEEDVLSVELSLERLRAARLDDFNWRDRRPELYGAVARDGREGA